MRNEGDAVAVSYGRLIEWDEFTFGLEQPEPAIEPAVDEEESGSEAEGEAENIPWLT